MKVYLLMYYVNDSSSVSCVCASLEKALAMVPTIKNMRDENWVSSTQLPPIPPPQGYLRKYRTKIGENLFIFEKEVLS
jgi:hypothetical protein